MFSVDMQIPLPWNISWEFVFISLQFIILKLGSRDWNSGRENDLCKTCGVNQRLKLFSLWSSTYGFILETSCAVLISPLGRSYFWMFYGVKLLPVCPWSFCHTEIALGIPTTLEDADGDLATHAEICLKFVCSYNIQLVKALNISTGFLS